MIIMMETEHADYQKDHRAASLAHFGAKLLNKLLNKLLYKLLNKLSLTWLQNCLKLAALRQQVQVNNYFRAPRAQRKYILKE
jgi:hypothetical protein